MERLTWKEAAMGLAICIWGYLLMVVSALLG